MKYSEAQGRARKIGINPIGKSRTDLIRSIQKAEGNRDCFNRGQSAACGQERCPWRADCK